MLRHSRTPDSLVNFLRRGEVDGRRSLANQACVLCASPGARAAGLCQACASDLPWNNRACHFCAVPVDNGDWCGNCLRSAPDYQRCVAAFVYDFPIANLIHLLKDRGQLWAGMLLGRLLASRLGSGSGIDAIVPVPIHPFRRLYRGFNQTEVIARVVSVVLGLPAWRCCKKSRSTVAQRGLSKAARHHSLAGSFAVTATITGHKLAIVDDVVTTGGTASELSRCLLAAGAESVEVWAVARTPERRRRQMIPTDYA